MNVLSAGAVQRGLETAAAVFQEETRQKLSLTFATAPVIRSKVEDQRLPFDVLIAPLEAMREFERKRLVGAGSSTAIGKVKAGVVVRQGDWQPDISTAQALKEELVACDSIVYTQGSSGVFAEELIQRLGIGEVVNDKTTRLADAGAVMKFLAGAKAARTIGFGQVTAIVLHADQGVKLVGPLPEEIQIITTYAAGIPTRTAAPELAQRFLNFLITPAAKAAFKAAAVE